VQQWRPNRKNQLLVSFGIMLWQMLVHIVSQDGCRPTSVSQDVCRELT